MHAVEWVLEATGRAVEYIAGWVSLRVLIAAFDSEDSLTK